MPTPFSVSLDVEQGSRDPSFQREFSCRRRGITYGSRTRPSHPVLPIRLLKSEIRNLINTDIVRYIGILSITYLLRKRIALPGKKILQAVLPVACMDKAADERRI